jgi:hypothetical protein
MSQILPHLLLGGKGEAKNRVLLAGKLKVSFSVGHVLTCFTHAVVCMFMCFGGWWTGNFEKTERKVKYILNCTPTRTQDPEAGVPNYFEKEATKPFKYMRIPIFDNKGEDILRTHIPAAIRYIEEGKHYGTVLVHCHKGSYVVECIMR